jgi:pimeloyl-ACP methyl ester carboxylesterase
MELHDPPATCQCTWLAHYRQIGKLFFYRPYAPWFALRHTVYAVDLRGHGLSGCVPDRYHVADFGEDIVAFIQGCVHAPAILVGGSIGGVVGAYVAARHPAVVKALVMIDPPFGPDVGMACLDRGFRDYFQRCHDLVSQGKTAAELRQVIGTRTSTDRRWAMQVSQLDVDVVDAILDHSLWNDWDSEAILAGITCPSLLVHGDVDKGGVLSSEKVEWLRSSLRDCMVDHLPMGHGPSPAQRPEVAMIICEFLESLE